MNLPNFILLKVGIDVLATIGAIIAILASAYLVYRMEQDEKASKLFYEKVQDELDYTKLELAILADYVSVDCVACMEDNLDKINQRIQDTIQSRYTGKESNTHHVRHVKSKKNNKRNNPSF